MMIVLHTVKAAVLCEEWKPKKSDNDTPRFYLHTQQFNFLYEQTSVNGCSVYVYYKGIFDREK